MATKITDATTTELMVALWPRLCARATLTNDCSQGHEWIGSGGTRLAFHGKYTQAVLDRDADVARRVADRAAAEARNAARLIGGSK